MKNSDQGKSPTWLIVKRILFGAVFVLMAGYVFTPSAPPPLSDSVTFLCTVFLIFLSLWWKRLYSYRYHDALITTAILMAMWLASWIRHGPFTVVYGVLAAPLPILMLAFLYLNRGEDDEV
jgi:hypothetical protein